MCIDCKKEYERSHEEFNDRLHHAKKVGELIEVISNLVGGEVGDVYIRLVRQLDNLASRSLSVSERIADKGYYASACTVLEKFRGFSDLGGLLIEAARASEVPEKMEEAENLIVGMGREYESALSRFSARIEALPTVDLEGTPLEDHYRIDF